MNALASKRLTKLELSGDLSGKYSSELQRVKQRGVEIPSGASFQTEAFLDESELRAELSEENLSEAQKSRGIRNFSSRSISQKALNNASRDEMNLAEFPLAVLSTRVDPSVKTLEFTDMHRSPTGELVERKWIITGADKFGLPTSTDDDVVLGLMRLSMSKGFRERKVYFTRYELLKTLRWSTEGRSYKRLIKSLDRLSGVRIRSTNSFYDNSSKAYQTCNFGIVDAYEINDERGSVVGPDEQPRSFFIWSEALFDSFKAGYIKKLDLELYFSLNSAISRRLYRYLDKHFYYKGSFERPLMQFAFEKLGLSRSYKFVSSIRQQLEPALDELIRVGFLSSYEFAGRGTAATIRFNARSSVGGSRAVGGTQAVVVPENPRANADSPATTMQFEPVRPSSMRQRSEQQLSENRPTNSHHRPFLQQQKGLQEQSGSKAASYIQQLIERGMAESQAKRLVNQKNAEEFPQLESVIAYYDSLVRNNDYKVSKNRVGFLYRAVEKLSEFKVPEEFSGLKSSKNGGQGAKRPELRLFKRAKSESADSRQEDYQVYLAKSMSQALSQLSETELKDLYAAMEARMSCLKPILSAERFNEAVEGCVRQEIQKRGRVLDFKQWSELQS